MPVTAIARELYALPPADFVRARNDRAKELTGSDAATVRGLKKPTPAAWLCNRLAGDHSDEVDQAIALGTDLVDAQRAGDRAAIMKLNGQRRERLRALVDLARSTAQQAGVPASSVVLEDVGQTLTAAMTDEAAAAALRSGLLVTSLESTGLEPVDLEGAVALGAPAAPRRSGSSKRAEPTASQRAAEARERKRAEEEDRKRKRARAEWARRHAEAVSRVESLTADLAEIDRARGAKAAELEKARSAAGEPEPD